MADGPTADAEVNALLGALLAGVREVLGGGLVGVYLFGSLAAGGFDRASDVDVLVVTEGEVSEAEFAALASMHDRLARRGGRWATQLEISYVPRAALRRYDPANNLHPHLDRNPGERLHLMRHDRDWVVQRHTLRERGLTLEGPDPRTLIDPVSPADLRAAMREILTGWFASFAADPSQLNTRGYQSYTVLTVCRVLYTLRRGAVTSKLDAARWAQQTLHARWSPLVGRALEGRQPPLSAGPPVDLDETANFIRHALELERQTPEGGEVP